MFPQLVGAHGRGSGGNQQVGNPSAGDIV